MSTNLFQLPVLPFIWASCCMEDNNIQKLYNKVRCYLFDAWIGSIKTALSREGQVSTATAQRMWLRHRKDSGSETLHWFSTWVPLSLAAVGSCGVVRGAAVFALSPVFVLVLVVTLRGQTAQHGDGGHFVPEGTARGNDEVSRGTDHLSSGQGLRVCEHAITWQPRWRLPVSRTFVGADRASVSCWLSALEPVATQRYSWGIKASGH